MNKLLAALFYFLVFCLPFGTRKLVWQFTEGFSEYAGAYLYATDIAMLGVLCFYVILTKVRIQNINVVDSSFRWNDNKILFVFLIISLISIFPAYSKGLAIYNFSRLLILAMFALITADLLKKQILKIGYIFGVLAASSVFQAIIGITQFIKQGSLGLYFLGEPVLSASGGGIAKMVVEGAKVLRAYGTFPHPNILAAFLLLGLFGFYSWYLRNPPPTPPPSEEGGGKNLFLSSPFRRERINPATQSVECGIKVGGVLIVAGIAIIILGLILTFSRAAWLVGGAMSVLFLGHLIFRPETRRAGAQLFFISGLSVAAFIFALYPYVAARAPIQKNEPSVVRRFEYNKMAFELIKNKPLGVGIGNQVIYSAREGIYQKFGMNKPWMWEPVHNLYLLVLAEMGIAGGITFVLFLLGLIISNYQFLISKQYPILNSQMNFFDKPCLPAGRLEKYSSSGACLPVGRSSSREILFILSAFLLLGLFDHYFWTIQQGRLMWWLVIGLSIMAIKSSKLC